MKLALGWMFIGVAATTALLLLASWVGWVKFSNRKQQAAVLAGLILAVIAACVAGITGETNLSPEETGMLVAGPYVHKAHALESELSVFGKMVSERDKQLARMKDEKGGLELRLEGAAKALDEQSDMVKTLREQLETVLKEMTPPEPQEDIGKFIKEMQVDLAKARFDLAEKEQMVQTLTARVKELGHDQSYL